MTRIARWTLAPLLLLALASSVAAAGPQPEPKSYSTDEALALAGQLAERMMMPLDKRAIATERLAALLQSGRFTTATGLPVRGVLVFHTTEGGLLYKVTSGSALLRWKQDGQYWGLEMKGKSFGAQLGGSSAWGFGIVVGPGDPYRLSGDYAGNQVSATFGVAATGGVTELVSQTASLVDFHRLFLVAAASGASANAGTAQLKIVSRLLVDVGAVTAPPSESYRTAPQPSPPPAVAVAPARATSPTCRMGSDGIQACGYHCTVGADGRAACANTPDGVCAQSSNGSVVCSQVHTGQPAPAPTPVQIQLQLGGRHGRDRAAPVEEGTGQRYCQTKIDCGAGLWCKDRGDGVHLCMARGGRGSFCNGTIDCGSGLWCKNRGDGLNVCM